jgi:hypothetical protein
MKAGGQNFMENKTMENLNKVQQISERRINSTANVAGLLMALFFPLLLLSACASGPPTREELLSADYGSPIAQQDAEARAKEFLKEYLKDPASAIYEWNPVYNGWVREAPLSGGGLKFGYLLDGNINAKNSYGGYTGFAPYQFFFHNGNIINVLEYGVKIY